MINTYQSLFSQEGGVVKEILLKIGFIQELQTT